MKAILSVSGVPTAVCDIQMVKVVKAMLKGAYPEERITIKVIS